jgi:hypothetical protein
MPEIRRILARLAGAAAALAIVLGGALASRAQIGQPPSHAELRLALRAASARLEVCRDRTAQELATLPAHLRQLQDCDEQAIDYRLAVQIDDQPGSDRLVSHSGVRHTRPLAIESAMKVTPGRHRVRVAFEPVRPAGFDDAPVDDDAAALRLLTAFRGLPSPRLDQAIDFAAGRAVLVTLDEDGALRLAR